MSHRNLSRVVTFALVGALSAVVSTSAEANTVTRGVNNSNAYHVSGSTNGTGAGCDVTMRVRTIDLVAFRSTADSSAIRFYYGQSPTNWSAATTDSIQKWITFNSYMRFDVLGGGNATVTLSSSNCVIAP